MLPSQSKQGWGSAVVLEPFKLQCWSSAARLLLSPSAAVAAAVPRCPLELPSCPLGAPTVTKAVPPGA